MFSNPRLFELEIDSSGIRPTTGLVSAWMEKQGKSFYSMIILFTKSGSCPDYRMFPPMMLVSAWMEGKSFSSHPQPIFANLVWFTKSGWGPDYSFCSQWRQSESTLISQNFLTREVLLGSIDLYLCQETLKLIYKHRHTFCDTNY